MKIKNNDLTIEDIMAKESDDAYIDIVQKLKVPFKPEHVFDENQSVKWNREKVVVENHIIKGLNEAILQNKHNGQNRFHKDLRFAISNGTNLSLNKADAIYAQAWENGHSNGYYEVIICADELMTLINSIAAIKD